MALLTSILQTSLLCIFIFHVIYLGIKKLQINYNKNKQIFV